MELTKRERIGLVVFCVIILSIISIYYFKQRSDSGVEVIKNSGVEKVEKDDRDIGVYVCGEVKKPGVYIMKQGDRIEKLINMAGGFTENADIRAVNLAAKLKDEDFIIIRSKILLDNSSTGVNPFGDGQTQDGKININTATKEQLKTLPRIGDAYAQRIIEYREKNGFFKDIKDIMKVSGIGEKMFENIKDKITVY